MEPLVIIGAGASGLTAGIMAGRRSIPCLFLEHETVAGRKLLATGNGKCNFTNAVQSPDCYYSEKKELAAQILKQFGHLKTLEFFQSLGMLYRERNGYFYPVSEQAATVRDLLLQENERLGNRFSYHDHVFSVEKTNAGFHITTAHHEYDSKNVILAMGGCVQKNLGSDGSGYELLRKTGHLVHKETPALTSLYWELPHKKRLAGIRTKGVIRLYQKELLVSEQTGELQFTDYGISGIPVFQFSRFVARKTDAFHVRMDFLPEVSKEELVQMIGTLLLRFRSSLTDEKMLCAPLKGLLHEKLLCYILEEKLSKETKKELFAAGYIKDSKALWHFAAGLAAQIKDFTGAITKTNDFEHAQVTAGGVDLSQVDPFTMESKKLPGMYITGELLDVDGICGGYNLQWAFTTGALAGGAVQP